MTHATPAPQRIQKLLAAEGLGSRRDIEERIRRGEVRINDRVAQLGDRVGSCDKLFISGRRVPLSAAATPRVIAYHKPCGEIVSRRDHSHPTVFARFPKLTHGRWVTIGRLDVNTSGLLLACTDGELAHRLMHPSYQIARIYYVRVKGEVNAAMLQRLHEGVMLGDRPARFEAIHGKEDAGGVNHWFEVLLREGRNREVRRLWESQGVAVSRLIRAGFAGIALDMPAGAWRELGHAEMLELYRAVSLEVPSEK